MKAALCKSLDGPDAIVIESIPDPKPGPGEALARVNAAALNFLDTLIVRGKYQFKPELPFSPSAEFAGKIIELGSGVTGLRIGQRVCCSMGWGAARELVTVKAGALIPVPDGVRDEIAATVNITYGTAIHGLKDRGHLRSGETVAVLGASGGAGLAAVEIAKQMGGKVIAVASTAEKLAVCKDHGADLLLNYTTSDLKQTLRDMTDGRGVDVIYDCVGGDHAEAALRSIAWQGRFLVVGFAAGSIPRIPLNLVLLKSCDIAGVFFGEAVRRDPARHRENMQQVLAWIAEGKLKPHIHASLPLEETGKGIRMLDRRESTGKVVLVL